MIHRHQSITKSGFSLVEVTLALGIVAFGLIAIFGLLPIGLGLVRESASEATAISVMGAVAIELRLGSISPPTTDDPLLFDSEGLPVEPGGGRFATYKAHAQVLENAKPKLANIQILWPEKNPVNLVETIVVLPDGPQ